METVIEIGIIGIEVLLFLFILKIINMVGVKKRK